MALYLYFSTKADIVAAGSSGPLTKQVPLTRITSANEEASFAAHDWRLFARALQRSGLGTNDLVWELRMGVANIIDL